MSTPPGEDPPPYQPSQWQQQPQQPPPSSQWQSQWQQPQPPQQQWGGDYQPSPPTPGNAIASLVLGICSIVLCPLICGVIGLVLGYGAKREIEASQGRLGGRGVAQAGIVTSWIGIAIWGILIGLWIIAIVASS